MHGSYRLVHFLRFGTVAAVLLWLIVVFGKGSTHQRYSDLFRQFRDERALFVEDFLEHDISGDFDGRAIADLCTGRTWTPDLILTCDGVPGNIADVKNGILTCIRIGIEIGAEIILPDIVPRSTANLAEVVPHDVGPRRGVPLDHFFDREYLTSTLNELCPELKIHRSSNEFYDKPSFLSAVRVNLLRMPGIKVADNLPGSGGRVVLETVDIGKQIHLYLDAQVPRRSRKFPLQVNLRPIPQFALPAFADPPELRMYFGRLLRVRRDLRELAAAVLFNLQTAFDLRLDPRKGIDVDAFVGLELRTQPDPRPFPDYEEQAADLLSFVDAHKMAQVYLTEGASPDNVTYFTERCRDFHIDVLTKEDLVEGADAERLAALTYDERFLVDYEVVLRAGLFAGHAQSSFAWNVALRREHAFGDPASDDASHLNGTLRWHNKYSTLYGKNNIGDELRRTIWP